LELVRYIHLNPLRAKLVSDLSELDRYRFGGHSVLMGELKNDWQGKIKCHILIFDYMRSTLFLTRFFRGIGCLKTDKRR
jgi:hypothetical protein